jgi:L-fuconolactonase
MEANSIGCAVLIGPPNMDESCSLRDLADSADEIAAVAVWVDVTSEDVGAHLDDLMKSPKMRSVALAVGQEPSNHWLLDDDTLRGLRLVAERGLRLDLEIEPRQLPSVGELARAIPELQIVIAHIGSPFIARSEREPWGVHMLNVAPHKNVYAKLSGLVALDAQPWSVAHQRLFVASMVRMLGYDRLMFGSDWPGHVEFASYHQVRESADLAAGPMTDAQHERVFGGTARAFYGLS